VKSSLKLIGYLRGVEHMKKVLAVLVVLSFVGAVQAADFVIENAGFEGGWMTQTMGWGGDPVHQVPVGWGTWTGGSNLENMYAIAGNGGGGGAALEVLNAAGVGGYSFLWTLVKPTVPATATSLTMYADVIDLTPGGAGGNFSGVSINGVETKFVGVTGQWQTFSFTAAIPLGTTAVELKIVNSTDQVDPKGGPCVYGFDNIRLVPEPMTMVLLGLGGLFLRRRSK
jgi:hypothetical protein